MKDPFAGLAERYLTSDATLRQVVRHTLVARQLEKHLPGPPARILDIGGGAGQQAIPLARAGYELTILDPSAKMLAEAHRRLESEAEAVRRRIRLVEHAGEDAPGIFGKSSFDAALCHGVLMYLNDPRPMVRTLALVVRPGGVVSVLAKNAAALAMRPALEGRYADALASLGADRDLGRLGVVTRGNTIEGLAEMFKEAAVDIERWYGVRMFTDHLRDQMPDEDLISVVELEWEAGGREPYRSVARLVHVVGRKLENTEGGA